MAGEVVAEEVAMDPHLEGVGVLAVEGDVVVGAEQRALLAAGLLDRVQGMLTRPVPRLPPPCHPVRAEITRVG